MGLFVHYVCFFFFFFFFFVRFYNMSCFNVCQIGKTDFKLLIGCYFLNSVKTEFTQSEVKDVETIKNKKLYTTGEAAKEWGVSQTVLRKWLKAGEIRSIKSGNRFYFTVDAFDRFIDGAEAAK